MNATYDFSDGFQKQILALMWRDSESHSIYQETLKPAYFEKDSYVELARIIFGLYRQFNCTPTLETVLEEIRRVCNQSKIERYTLEATEMYTMELRNFEYIKERIIDFGRKQAMTKAILDSVEDVRKGANYDKVLERVKKATEVGLDLGDLGSDYFEGIPERFQRDYFGEESEKIPTGVEYLDKIMSGGLGRKELGIVIAPPGRGKTITLVNIGAHALLKKKHVLHISLEMSEASVQKRYDNRILHKSSDYIKENPEHSITALSHYGKATAKLIVKEFPPRTCTPEMVEALLMKLKIAKGFVPDVILIDYPDLMKPSRAYGERRTELELLYEDCRAIAVKYDCAVWGASQANRGSLSKEVVTIADLAESFGKAAVADFMIAICQTTEEKDLNQLRYFVAKHRNGQDSETVCCDIIYEQMYVKSNEELQAVFEVNGYGDDVSNKQGQHKQSYKQQEIQEDTISQLVMKTVKGSDNNENRR